jgi:hypothetical protein
MAAPKSGSDRTSTSVAELVGDVARDVSTLVRQELELAKAETRQELAKAGKAGGAFGGAALAGWLMIVFASLAAMFGLGAVMPLGWAALIVAGCWGIAATILALTGRARIKTFHAVPTQTLRTVKEDVRWLQQTRNS